MNHKIRSISSMNESRLNDILKEEFENGYEPISIGYGEGIGGNGTVILFKKIKKVI